MLPKRLELQAFGPYVKKQSIDFSAFVKNRLFLIEGETGSGKTMLLDAMTYALYGKSSGGQREELESMRSRFAPEHLPTFIDFTFMIRDKEYRFYRSVEVRTKRNKEKTAKVKVDAGEIVEGTFIPFFENPKLRNVEEKAQELIGLSYAQFVQVMLLPQGKFEQFLTSKSEAKQEILKTLFQMERWSSINSWLGEQLQSKRHNLDSIRQRIAADLRVLESESIEEAQKIVTSLTQQLAVADEQKSKLMKQEEELQTNILQQKEYMRWQQEYEQKQQLYEKAKQQESTMRQRQQQVKRWQKVQALQQLYLEQQRLQRVAQVRQQQLQTAAQRKKIAVEQYQTLATKKEQVLLLEEKETQQLQKCQQLNEQVQLANEVEALQQKEKLAQQAFAKARLHVEQGQKQMEELQKKEALYQQHALQWEAESKKHQQIKEDWQRYSLANQRFQKQTAIAKQLTQQQRHLQEMKQAYDIHSKRLEQLQLQHETLYQQFLDNSALQFAQSLQEGKPCPICGSLHHPQPYILQQAAVDIFDLRALRQQVEAAKQDLEERHRVLEQANTTSTLLKNQLEDLASQIMELIHQPFKEADYILLQQTYLQVEEKTKAYEDERRELQTLLQKKIKLQQQILTYNEELQNKQQAYIIAKTTCANMKKQLSLKSSKELQLQLGQLKQDIKGTQNKKQTLQRECETILIEYNTALEHHRTAEIECQQAIQALTTHSQTLKQQMLLQDVEESELAALSDVGEIKEQEQQLQQYFLTLATLQKELQEQKNKLANITRLDLDELHTQYAACRKQLQQLEEQLAQNQTQVTLYTQTLQTLTQLAKHLKEEEVKFLKMQHFVRAMRGDNGIGIERYVLGVLLDSITAQANKLLAQIHEGRYQIFRNDDTTGRTRKYGLELSIFDTYSMEPRNVVSLSGGEKFLVSLAMSLALSMVVQARNGGVRFECLFIDEGFGTLDEHSIADALAILETMTQGKGMIGIISHVEILKENIRDGIEVVKTREGSFTYLRKEV